MQRPGGNDDPTEDNEEGGLAIEYIIALSVIIPIICIASVVLCVIVVAPAYCHCCNERYVILFQYFLDYTQNSMLLYSILYRLNAEKYVTLFYTC